MWLWLAVTIVSASLDDVSNYDEEVQALARVLKPFRPDARSPQRRICSEPLVSVDGSKLQRELAQRRDKLARPHVTILMVTLGSCLADYGHHAVALQWAYADRWGYDLVVQTEPYPDDQSHPARAGRRPVARACLESARGD